MWNETNDKRSRDADRADEHDRYTRKRPLPSRIRTVHFDIFYSAPIVSLLRSPDPS